MAKALIAFYIASYNILLKRSTVEKRAALVSGILIGRSPVGGIHVRRTDKIGSGVLGARKHPVSHYMAGLEAWWRQGAGGQAQVQHRGHLRAQPG